MTATHGAGTRRPVYSGHPSRPLRLQIPPRPSRLGDRCLTLRVGERSRQDDRVVDVHSGAERLI
jgi:hypothetical protein